MTRLRDKQIAFMIELGVVVNVLKIGENVTHQRFHPIDRHEFALTPLTKGACWKFTDS